MRGDPSRGAEPTLNDEELLRRRSASSLQSEATSEASGLHLEPDRHCTDAAWILVFLALHLTLLPIILPPSSESCSELYPRACNSTGGEKHYLYYCARSRTRAASLLQALRPDFDWMLDGSICIPHCPGEKEKAADLAKNFTLLGVVENETGRHDVQCGADYSTVYESVLRYDNFCAPAHAESQLRKAWLSRMMKENPKVIVNGVLHDAWLPACRSAAFGVFFSLVFLLFLRGFAAVVIWASLAALILVPLAAAVICGYCFRMGELPGVCEVAGSFEGYFINGMVCGVVGMTGLCMARNQSKTISHAVLVIQESCRCIWEARVILIVPLVETMVRLPALVFLLLGFKYLSDQGECPRTQGGVVQQTYDWQHLAMRAAFLFLFCFYMQFFSAFSCYVVMFLTRQWYFDAVLEGRHEPEHFCTLLKAVWSALRFHFGTLVRCSLMLLLTAPLRWTLGKVVGFSRIEGNCIGAILLNICCCFTELYDRCIEAQDSLALMEVVLTSSSWGEATRKVLTGMKEHSSAVAILNGVTALFSTAGVAVTALMGWFMTTWYLQSHSTEGDFQQTSPTYLSYLAFLGAFFSIIETVPLHCTYGTVGEAILYCWKIEANLEEEEQEHKPRHCCAFITCIPMAR